MISLISSAVRNFREGGVTQLSSVTKRYFYTEALQKYIWLTSDTHAEAYNRWVSHRINQDGSQAAVGGFERGIGTLQFEFLRDNAGLEPQDKLLDIGCGCLRAGRYFIDYLDAGNYTGMDVNSQMIEESKKFVQQDREDLAHKNPTLLVNDDLRFNEFDTTFDYLLAHSVFTHLSPDEIKECLTNVPQVMHSDSAFYISYNDAEDFDHEGKKTLFSYSKAEWREYADQCGVQIEFVDPAEFDHPSNQRLAKITIE